MQHKLSQAIQHALVIAGFCCLATAMAAWIVLGDPIGRNAIASSGGADELRRTLVPLTLLVSVMCIAAGITIWLIQRRQAFVRVSGIRRDRAADLLLPMYITTSLLRIWLLLLPTIVALVALMASGERMLAFVPSLCLILMMTSLPTRGRFERLVESGIAAHV